MFDNTYIYIISVIASYLLITIIKNSYYIGKIKNYFFICSITSNIFVFIGYILRDLSEQLKLMSVAYMANILTYTFAPLIMFFLIVASVQKFNLLIKICCFFEVVSIIIALSSPITGLFFSVSSDVVYSRGPLYIFNEILGIVYIIIWGICSYIEFRYVEAIDKLHMIEMIAADIIAVLLQGYNSTYKIIYIGGTFIMMLYYAFVIEVNAKYDNMTRVRNRAYFDAFVSKIKANAKYLVIVYDVNGLKTINDKLGHVAGDMLISSAADAIRKAIAQKGTIYRTGGDEFVAIIKSDSESVVHTINTEMDKAVKEINKELPFELSVSSGYAFHISCEEFSEVLKEADKNMYKNKEQYYKETGKQRRT